MCRKKRFRVCRQHDSMQCGAACLQMICQHFGKHFTLEGMANRCHVTTSGVSMLGISHTAQSLGLQNATAKIPLSRLTKDACPCILHWNQNHFVVLYDVTDGNTYHIADPAKGRVRHSSRTMQEHWISIHSANGDDDRGIAMFFEPTDDFFNLEEERVTRRQHLHTLLQHVSTFRTDFLRLFLLLLTGSALGLVIPFLTQAIVDRGIAGKDISLVWLILLGQLVLTVSRSVADLVRRWVLLRISLNINLSLISRYFQKLLKLPMSFFDTKLMGDLMQRLGDHGRLNNFLTSQAMTILFSIVSMLVFAVVLCIYDWSIFLIFTVGSLLYAAWMLLFLERRKFLDYEYFEQQSRNNNKTFGMLWSMQEIKLQGCEQRILLARAIYRQPKYLFLDEATNSLDVSNEHRIVDNLAHFYMGRSVVVVAHRLSTVMHADQIVVMDKGHICEIGTHESLIAKRGKYYELITASSQNRETPLGR